MRLAILLWAALLCACGSREPVADNVGSTDSLPTFNEAAPSATGGPPPPENLVLNGASEAVSAIPAALHGRWGLTPADCDSPRGSAEGLLVIGGNELRFYESVAVPAASVVTGEQSIGGDFNFTGEGQSWTKYQSLRLRDRLLVRTERNPVASFRYVRCD